MDNIIEKYLTEGRQENAVAKAIQKKFGVKVKNVDVQRKIVFTLAKGIDEQDWDNFKLIDDINDFLEKTFKTGIVKHDYDKFIVEE